MVMVWSWWVYVVVVVFLIGIEESELVIESSIDGFSEGRVVLVYV